MKLPDKNNWILIGVTKNWERALSHPVPIWGLKEKDKYNFEAMEIGDLIWFYSTSPIKGIIGVGLIKDKYVDTINLFWDEEKVKKEVIWPLRFRIQVLKVLPRHLWKTDKILIDDFNIFWQTSIIKLASSLATEIYKRASKNFGITSSENLYSGTTIQKILQVREAGPEYSISHRELQEEIAEIGKLQFYYTELEYLLGLPGEKKNIDVVWKREIDGAPTFSFEVELAGMLEKAIERLKFAFRKWNSRPRLIVEENFIKKVNNIISAEERDFVDQMKIYRPEQISDILKKKQELKGLEEELRLY